MSRKLQVFVSATSKDLRTYRNMVAGWLRDQGHQPVVQDEFAVQPDFVTVAWSPCPSFSPLRVWPHGFDLLNHFGDNQASAAGRQGLNRTGEAQEVIMKPDATPGTQQEVRSRSELARQLLARVERLAPRLGDVSLAVEIQLLKRELARGHPVLSARAEDNNFLSVVTLVEAALASLTWKAYTPQVLDALRRAFAAGASAGEVPFEEYDAIRRHFKASGIATGPTIDLDSTGLAAEDEDGPQA